MKNKEVVFYQAVYDDAFWCSYWDEDRKKVEEFIADHVEMFPQEGDFWEIEEVKGS